VRRRRYPHQGIILCPQALKILIVLCGKNLLDKKNEYDRLTNVRSKLQGRFSHATQEDIKETQNTIDELEKKIEGYLRFYSVEI